ncbi:unnamed protein product [Prorocentrum cordatum]|uniref:Uncharacterized protein n=1 Tax=Prorocentrum cordatum TaxID=2364126 RepID=A0ABN9R8A1_9DINO|nr:unnamed protein product [Polarella glacialis]
MPDDADSLYSLLRKAKPVWSGQELRRVHEKLGRVDIRDAESLGRAVCEGRLNAALASAGERRLKSSTVTQLKVLVRDVHRAKQAEQESESITGLRRCYCGDCRYCAAGAQARELRLRAQATSEPCLVWPPSPSKKSLASPRRASGPASSRRPPAFAGAQSPALRRTGESLAAGAGGPGQRSAADRLTALGSRLRDTTERLAMVSQESGSLGSCPSPATGMISAAWRQTSRTRSGLSSRPGGRASVESAATFSSAPSHGRPSLRHAASARSLHAG